MANIYTISTTGTSDTTNDYYYGRGSYYSYITNNNWIVFKPIKNKENNIEKLFDEIIDELCLQQNK